MTKPVIIPPYGGELVNLLIPDDRYDERKTYAGNLHSIQLSEREICDLELLAVGGFSPLTRFMGKADHDGVVNDMRLADGTLWPIPIVLTVNDEDGIDIGMEIALRDRKNRILAIMHVEEKFVWDRKEVARKVFGTLDSRHPIVADMNNWGKYCISGKLAVLEIPVHYDFAGIRRTPAQTRAVLEEYGRSNVVAFQTRNPMHRVHEELTKRAIDEIDGVLLLHPVVGMTKPGDVDHYTRVRTYRALVDNYYEPERVCLSLLPLAMRMGGPREAVWHAIIRRNYGANHFIVGRDHAGPGNDSQGNPIYGPYDAQELVTSVQEEIGVTMVPFKMVTYLPGEDRYEEISKVTEGTETLSISGTQVRNDYLKAGVSLPSWFTRPEVATILADAYPPSHKQGVCIWFTGLSGSGKSTTAEVLISMIYEFGRDITLLDGDIVRTHLSKGLGFSKEDRDTNIRRIGFVAAEVVKHGGLAVCAAVSPYRATRNEVRYMMNEGEFIEIFVDTPLEVCEDRDTKGLYARARRGEIKDFTGIDDPYEAPANPELRLTTVGITPEENAQKIIDLLLERGLLRQPEDLVQAVHA